MNESVNMNLQMNLPLVTICIPVYNGDKFIEELLESIKKQTYTNFKCHIVNNASTDQTKTITEKCIADDDRFTLHTYTEFADIIANWNRTVNHMDPAAKYFKVVQADDYLFPESLETMVDLMEKYPTAGIGTSYRLVQNKLDGYGIQESEGSFHNGKEILLKHLNDKMEVTGSITQLFFRIEHLKKVPTYPMIFNPEDYHDDTRLAYEMFYISDMVFAFKALNISRRHDNAETTTTVEKYNTLLQGKESRLFRFKEFYPELEKKYSRVRRGYGYFIFKSILRRDKETLAWHRKFLRRRITAGEMIKGLLLENRFGSKLAKQFGL
jgi:glycosyltransferase involved in cell wall biosynthesis